MSLIFDNSQKIIDDILSQTKNRNTNFFSKSATFSNLNESFMAPIRFENNKTLIEYDRNFIKNNFGENDYSFEKIQIGTHPDFSDLNHTNFLMHHCVSMFVDIKGSTKLIDNYSIGDVRLIKDTILTLIINVANQFGGHVQRLQGDGVFLAFIRRGKHHINSIINALNCSSLLTQFISEDLAEIFKKNDIVPLRIRIGIDYGDDENVLWSYYGIPGCDELTTTSLHTDMAAKLQSKAFDNSIIIGNNIVTELDIPREFISNYYNEENKREEVFQITPTLTYKFYVFEWKKFLNQHPNFKLLASNILKHEIPRLYLKCQYKFQDVTYEYYPNSKGIPKYSEITFILYENENQYLKKNFEEIKWTIFNTGNEAKLDNCLIQEVDEESNNQIFCNPGSKYLGLHKIQCKLIRNHSDNLNIEFPVIIF